MVATSHLVNTWGRVGNLELDHEFNQQQVLCDNHCVSHTNIFIIFIWGEKASRDFGSK